MRIPPGQPLCLLLHRNYRSGELHWEKMTFENEKHRAIWQDVLKLELISSEESGYDDGDEVIYVKPLPWRSKQFSEFVARLDIQAVSNKSAMAKRQSKRRLVGEPSARVCPTTDVPDWVFADK